MTVIAGHTVYSCKLKWEHEKCSPFETHVPHFVEDWVLPSYGLLIFCDVAISHNWPQIATFRIIHQKSHNSDEIAKFEKRKRKYSLLTYKFYDNLSVVSRWFTSQKTLEIIKIVCERSIEQTGVLCIVLHVADLVLKFSKESDCSLAKNKQSFVLMGHSQ